MIRPDQFYGEDERPSPAAKRVMWNAIHDETTGRKSRPRFIADRTSFFAGMAAAVLLYFATVGIVTTVRQSVQSAQPEAIRLDAAYQSAIEQFENVVPQVVSAHPATAQEADYLNVRKEQLATLDKAIAELRQENPGRDISPLLQKRARQLYSLKLKVLQEMVEKGEIEL